MRIHRSGENESDAGHASDLAGQAATLNGQAASQLDTDAALAARLATEALALAEQATDAALTGRTLHLLGQAAERLGDTPGARSHLARAVECFAQGGRAGQEFEVLL